MPNVSSLYINRPVEPVVVKTELTAWLVHVQVLLQYAPARLGGRLARYRAPNNRSNKPM